MEAKLELEIPVLLPEVEDERDQCVERLTERLDQARGITRSHVLRRDSEACLCMHYDPESTNLAHVERVARQAGAEVAERYKHETLWIRGMDCADCASSVEHILDRADGVLEAAVSYSGERLRIEYDGDRVGHDAIVQRVHSMGYEVDEGESERGWLQEHIELGLALTSGLFLAAGFLGQAIIGLPDPLELALYGLAYVAGGYNAARHGVRAAIHLRFDVDFLMVIAALGAAVVGAVAEGALLLFLFSLGHALEHRAMDRARGAIRALGQIAPRVARLRGPDGDVEIAVEDLGRGDLVVIRPGERVPVDGQIGKGRSAIDESTITGESLPVEKEEGDDVFAGTVNGEGSLEVKVMKLARDTTLARVVTLVEEAQTQRAPTQRFTQRFTAVFVPAVLVVAVAVAVVPSLAGWLDWDDAFLRSMAVLVAASPCALAIGTPAAVLSALARAARGGVLIKGGAHLESLGAVRAMAFDKTGTITRGEPEVTDLAPLDDVEPEELLRTAAAVESNSAHPLAQALVRRAREEGLELPEAGELQSLTGLGVQAELEGRLVRIGKRSLFADTEHIPAGVLAAVGGLQELGRTTMVVQADDAFLGVIGLADRPRDGANETVQRLEELGVSSLTMLTGDNERVAAGIARQVGLTAYRADLLPEDKVVALEELMAERGAVAMVGDGVNDAPALAQATVGIAMGAGGSDVALETADVALMADDFSRLPFAVGLGRRARRIIRQNLLVSLGVILILVPATIVGATGIAGAIILHEGSTLAVVGNALRLLGGKRSDA